MLEAPVSGEGPYQRGSDSGVQDRTERSGLHLDGLADLATAHNLHPSFATLIL